MSTRDDLETYRVTAVERHKDTCKKRVTKCLLTDLGYCTISQIHRLKCDKSTTVAKQPDISSTIFWQTRHLFKGIHGSWNFLLFSISLMPSFFPSVHWHCWLGDRRGVRPVNRWVLVSWRWRYDWSFACLLCYIYCFSCHHHLHHP